MESVCRVGAVMQRFSKTVPVPASLLPAIAAFNHGTEFAAPTGPGIAVEDLEPGMELRLIDGTSTTLLWIGALDLSPSLAQALCADGSAPLVRILPDRFGFARPARDLVMGAEGRLARPDGRPMRAVDAVDYEGILPLTPPGPVRLYQVVTDRPGALLIANGLGVPAFGLRGWLDQQDSVVQGIVSHFLPGGPHTQVA